MGLWDPAERDLVGGVEEELVRRTEAPRSLGGSDDDVAGIAQVLLPCVAGPLRLSERRDRVRAEGTLKFRPVLRFDGPVRSLVDEDLAPDVLAVLGEALSNAGRHADASSVEVLLAAGDSVVLTVTDDGRGLPADVAESGLGNMRRRAQARGGTFEVSSGPDSGTRLVWSAPSAARVHAPVEPAEGAGPPGT